jgi:hypothetical protein
MKKSFIHNEEEFYKNVKVEENTEKLIVLRNYLTSVEFGKIISNPCFFNLKYINL